MNKNTIISIIIIVVAVIAGLIILQSASNKAANRPGEYDALANHLTESGAMFYGAFWCPHCNNQKQAFGRSAKLLPYTECSTPDGNGQTDVCIEMRIESYPTWILADGTRLSGVQTPEYLAEVTGFDMTDIEITDEEIEIEIDGETSSPAIITE